MHKQRIALIIASVLGIIATFLPWVDVSILVAINGTKIKGHGWITLIIFIVPLVITLLGDRKSPVNPKIKYINVVAGLLLAGIGIWEINNINSNINSMISQFGGGLFGNSIKSSISIGIGLYLLIIAGIAVAVISFLPKLFGGFNAIEEPPERTMNSNIQDSIKNKSKTAEFLEFINLVRQRKATIIIIALILVLFGGLLGVGYMQSTPEASAKKFMDAILSKNGTASHESMYLPKTMTTEEKDTMKKDISNLDISKIDAKSIKISVAKPADFTGTLKTSVNIDGKDTTDFKVLYASLKVNGKMETNAIYMIKSGNNFLVFDRWVALSDFYSSPLLVAKRSIDAQYSNNGKAVLEEIYVPKDATSEEKDAYLNDIASSDFSSVDKASLVFSLTKPATYTGTVKTSVTIEGKDTTDFKVLYYTYKDSGKTISNDIYLARSGKIFFVFDRWVVLGKGYLESTPEAGAKKFWDAYFNGNGEVAFENLYIYKTLTETDKASFVELLNVMGANVIDKSSLVVSKTKPDGFTDAIETSVIIDGKKSTDFKVVYVSYKDSSNVKSTFSIYMVKQGKNSFIYDKWVVHFFGELLK